MTRSVIFAYMASILFCGNAFAQNKITVEVKNILSEEGVIYVGFYKPDEDFPNHDAKHIKRRVKPSKGKVELAVSDLPPGTYAVAVLHDINDNDKLEKNFLGFPTEPYGFSKNIHHTFSAPTFDECKFTLADKPVTLSIELKQ